MSDRLAQYGAVLRKENEEFRRLFQEHRAHEERLAALRAKAYLSEEEKLEEVGLKKRKLFLKDRMALIASRYDPKEVARR